MGRTNTSGATGRVGIGGADTSSWTGGHGGTAQGGSAPGSAGRMGEAGSNGEGSPILDQLVITGAEAPLMPTFEPNHARYSVLATSPIGTLSLTATAPSGVDIVVDGVAVDSGQALALPEARPGDEIHITVSDATGDSRTYEVIYLPANFARFVVTVHEPGASTDPLYLAPSEAGSTFIAKLDNFGVPLFYKQIAGGAMDFKKHLNGQMSYARNHSMGAEFNILDQDFVQIDTVTAIDIARTDDHELLILANGNYVVIGEERATRDLTEYGGAAEGAAIDNAIQEITPDKQLVYDWNTWDRLAYDENVSTNEEDYAHLNSVVEDMEGDWIVSSRHQAQVFKIDRDSGDIVWRLGGISGDFEFVNDPYGGLCGQHTASQLANGNILVFDNGIYCYPDMPERERVTRVAEFELDETAMTAKLVWSYESPTARSSAQGSAQRLPNGNTLIAWGTNGDDPVMATEVDAEGSIVFQLEARLADGSRVRSYRAFRFAD